MRPFSDQASWEWRCQKRTAKCETNNTSGIMKHIDTYWDRQTVFKHIQTIVSSRFIQTWGTILKVDMCGHHDSNILNPQWIQISPGWTSQTTWAKPSTAWNVNWQIWEISGHGPGSRPPDISHFAIVLQQWGDAGGCPRAPVRENPSVKPIFSLGRYVAYTVY